MRRGIEPHVLLGLDVGGTKTEAVALSLRDGRHCRHVLGGSNYQGKGIRKASEVWSEAVCRCLSSLGADTGELAAAGLGVAGLDRPRDEAVIRPEFEKILDGIPFLLVNDLFLVVRAGTPDGVGVAVISGTGCNAGGVAADGRRFRVGGIGPEFGDLGSATDIGVEALRKAFRALDGRGPETLLGERIRTRLGLERLDDIVDFFLADGPALQGGERLDAGLLAPLVFETAAEGDRQAIAVLEWAGRELGLSVRAVARRLFGNGEPFRMVMGGSVLQRGKGPHLADALLADVEAEFPQVVPVVLGFRPVSGAVRYALDLYEEAKGDRASAGARCAMVDAALSPPEE